MFIRILKLEESVQDSLFLWGARQTGKSTLLKTLFPNVRRYDLLNSEEFERLFRNPELLREELKNADTNNLVIIDEVQKIPQLLNEIQWLISMEVAAQCSGEMIVYKNIAQDCGLSANTVKEYFNILEQTMIGYLISGFTSTLKRRAIAAPKFYYFDVGIANYLLKRNNITQGTDVFGHAFEHLIIQELIAYLGYTFSNERLTYWRTSGGYEVDCIIGNGRIAIELKSCNEVKSRHIKGLKAFQEEYPQVRLIVVSMDKYTVSNKLAVNAKGYNPDFDFDKQIRLMALSNSNILLIINMCV